MRNKTERKPFYKRWWFFAAIIPLVLLVGFTVAVVSLLSTDDFKRDFARETARAAIAAQAEPSEVEKPAPKKVDKPADKTEKDEASTESKPEKVEAVAETKPKAEAKKKDSKLNYEKKTYTETIKPAAVAIMDDMAVDWQNNWEITLPAYEAGRLNAATTHNRMTMAWEYLLQIDRDAIKFDKKKSTESGRKQITELDRAIDDAIINRMSATDIMADAIDEGHLKPSDANAVSSHVAQADQALAKAAEIIAELDTKYEE